MVIDLKQKLEELKRHKCTLIDSRRAIKTFYEYAYAHGVKNICGGMMTEKGQYVYLD